MLLMGIVGEGGHAYIVVPGIISDLLSMTEYPPNHVHTFSYIIRSDQHS